MKTSANHLEHDWFPEPLPDNVALGKNSWCYSSYSCLHCRSDDPSAVRAGAHTGIYHGTFFDLGPQASIIIGDYCTIVGAIFSTNHTVEIGDYCFIAHEVVLADSFAATPSPTNHSDTTPGITLESNCWIGARSILLSGAHIGEGAIIGAGAVIDFKVPPFTIAAGNPGRIVGEVRRENSQSPTLKRSS